MSETCCHLKIHGLATREEFSALVKIISGRRLACEEDISDVLLRGDWIQIEDIWLGVLPLRLSQVLNAACLSYIWDWDASAEKTPGRTIYDGLNGKTADFDTIDTVVALRVDELGNAEKVAAARHAHGFLDGCEGIITYESQHELLQVLERHPEMRPYHAARLRAQQEAAERAAEETRR